MTTERDELAAVIARRRYAKNARPSVWITGRAALEVADAILAAGYRKPWTITTAEELDALRLQTVIRDAEGYVWERYGSDPASWDCAGVPDWGSNLINLPAVVLWEAPDA